jgi:hypothetical protein
MLVVVLGAVITVVRWRRRRVAVVAMIGNGLDDYRLRSRLRCGLDDGRVAAAERQHGRCG